MSNVIFTAHLAFDKFRFSCDLTQASSPIRIETEDGEFTSTQYQVADARHREHDALKLALSACGRDYFAEPDDERDSDDIIEEICDGVDIERDDEREEE